MNKLASIDIGTNTVRLLILEVDDNGNFSEIDSDRVITRLGEGVDTRQHLSEHRMQSTLDVLERFGTTCRGYGSIPIHAVATSAVREADNGHEFLRRAREKTGIDIEVIPWEEEAALTLEGVFWKIDHQNRNIVTFDIGGGSTEFILSKGKDIIETAGTFLGTVRLTEKFISQHPVAEREYQALENHLRQELKAVRQKLSRYNPDVLIGTAGTVTTLAALENNVYPYDPGKIHGCLLNGEQVRNLMDDLKSKSIPERLRMKPLEEGREDLIIAGTAIVLETMRAFSCDRLIVSEYGLREGILLKAIRNPGNPT